MTRKLSLRGDDLAWRTVDDELIAIDVRDSTYLSSNDSGLLMWNALAAGTTKEELVRAWSTRTASTPEPRARTSTRSSPT